MNQQGQPLQPHVLREVLSSLFFVLAVNIVFLYFLSLSTFSLILRLCQFITLFFGKRRNQGQRKLYMFIFVSNFWIALWHLAMSDGKATPLFILFAGSDQRASRPVMLLLDILIMAIEASIVSFLSPNQGQSDESELVVTWD